MEVTALCVRRLMDVFVLLAAQAHHSDCAQRADAAFPHVVPDRLQFFEYETISVRCEPTGGITDWRVMRRPREIIPTNSSDAWDTSAPSCTIYPAFERDSGQYWCENEDGETSDAVDITITGGSVILELPVRPVTEGEDVTLHCNNNRNTESKHIVDFYRDGSPLGTRYYSTMTIPNVSKSDEGLYKCSISGAGVSPESWLAVITWSEAPDEASPAALVLLCSGVGVSVVTLLLVVMGVHRCRKHRASASREDDGWPDTTYAVVNKNKGGGDEEDPDNLTYVAVTNQRRKRKETEESRAAREQDVIYSSINCKTEAAADGPLTADWRTEEMVCSVTGGGHEEDTGI